MAKVTLSTITSGYQDANAINDNFTALATALENTLSRDGTTPNTLTADLDLNGNLILNQATDPTADSYTWTGDWATATAYELNDLVFVTVATDGTYGGAAYICRVAHTAGTFSTDYITNSYWNLVAARGASGAGSGDLVGANSLGDIVSTGGVVATARTNLGLGTSAVEDLGWSATGNVVSTTQLLTVSDLQISGNEVEPTRFHHTLEPETGTTDGLDTLTNTSTIDGALVLLRLKDSGDTITIGHGVDNIYLDTDENLALSSTDDSIILQRRGTDWFEVSRSITGASGKVLQVVKTITSSSSTITTTMPFDDNVKTNSEGGQLMSLAITPVSATSTLYIEVGAIVSSNTGTSAVVGALFVDATANALSATVENPVTSSIVKLTLHHAVASGSTSARTYKFYSGPPSSGTLTFNGSSGSRKLGGIANSYIIITEVEA